MRYVFIILSLVVFQSSFGQERNSTLSNPETSNTNAEAKAKFEQANNSYIMQNYENAILNALEAVKLEPDYYAGHMILGMCYFQTGKYFEANKYLGNSLKLKPPATLNAFLFYYYARTFHELQLFESAVYYFKKTIATDSTNFEAYTDIVKSLTSIRAFEEAAKYLELKIAKGKAISNDYYQLGKVYYNNQQWEKADQNFGFVTSKNPDFVKGWYWQALTNVNMDPESTEGKAKPYFESLITAAIYEPLKYSEELTAAYEYLGYYFFLKKDWCTSKTFWNEALRINSENEKAKAALDYLSGECR